MFFTRAATSILKTNLGIKRGEKVLIFTDKPGKTTVTSPPKDDLFQREKIKEFCLILRDLAGSLTKEAIFYEYAETGMHGIEPPEGLWKRAFGERVVSELKRNRLLARLLKKKIKPEELRLVEKIIKAYAKRPVNVVIALSKYSTSHTNFRDLLTRVCRARYASMPLFEISMLEGPMNVDWKALKKRTELIASALNRAETITITTPNGTEISFSVKGRKVFKDTGILTRPGAFGNLPAGEVFLAPLEGTANGTLILEWAPTRPLSYPLKLYVRDGYVKDIEGDDPFKEDLLRKLRENPLNANIAELGIGTNEGARRPDNILESEKILGTIHIALGDNSSFGGRVRTPFHQDFVFFRPTVKVKRGNKEETIISDGKLKSHL